MKTRDLDKSMWSKGEWDLEPDRVDFRHVGLDCLMLRNHLGVWCGYVGVPKTHPAFEKDYNDYDDYSLHNIDVHGGLTYSGYHSFSPIDGLWWFGFDCNHHMDLQPLNYFALGLDYEPVRGTYKNMEYVTNEVNRLAEQLAEMKSD